MCVPVAIRSFSYLSSSPSLSAMILFVASIAVALFPENRSIFSFSYHSGFFIQTLSNG